MNGRFHLVRLNRRQGSRQDAWFLIKGHGEYERPGLFQAIELVANRTGKRPFDPAPTLHARIKHAALDRGLAVY